MTVVSDIIKQAYRESNLIPLSATPNSMQTEEALKRLNALLLSAIGNEAGDELTDININVGNTYDQSHLINQYIPPNVRMFVVLSESDTFTLHPQPYDGQRVAVTGDFGTYNLTLDGNGRTIEGTSTLTLAQDGEISQWMFRSDIGDWVLIDEIEEEDDWPLPIEFDDYFIIMLALRLNPRYGQQLTGESATMMKRMRTQMQARYRRKVPADFFSLGLIRPDRRFWTRTNSNEDFDAGGWGWP